MEILPSYLNVNNLQQYLYKVNGYNKTNNNKIKCMHVDVMDGKFVKNHGVELESIIDVKNRGYIADVHLMVESPETYIDRAISYGADIVTIHVEIENLLEKIKFIKDKSFEYKKKVKVGLAISPETSFEELKPYVNFIDHILIMTVEPGQGGQSFIEEMYMKIENVKNMLINAAIYNGVDVCVDGGISDTNIAKVEKLGANMVVVGSYLSSSKTTEEFIEKMNKLNN